MVKSSAPWLRSLLRAGKKQQKSVARALTVLLTPAKPVKAKAAPKAKPKAAAKAVTKTVPKVVTKAAPKTVVKAAAKATPKAVPKLAKPLKPAITKPGSGARGKREALPSTLAPACGKWMAANYGSLADPGKRMSYWLYVPQCAPAPRGLPLLVMLHGCDQSATLFAQGTRMNQMAEQAGYAVVYPQQSVSSHPHRCWKWYDRATQQGGGDVGLIVGIVHDIMARYPIDRSRVFIGGISAGAGMANIVALNHPDLFAALGMHSGPLYGAGHSTVGALGVMRHGALHRVDPAIAEVRQKRPHFPPMPTILIQGDDDQVVRPVNQAQLRRQAMLINELPEASEVRITQRVGNKRVHPHQLHDVFRGRKLMLRVAKIAELRHAWSGGDESLSFNSGAGPDASKMLLEFFSKHRRI